VVLTTIYCHTNLVNSAESMLIGKCDSKYMQRAWCVQSLSHWCMSPILIDLSKVTRGRLLSYQLDQCVACWEAGCRLMSSLLRRCYTCHTCSLWILIWALFLPEKQRRAFRKTILRKTTKNTVKQHSDVVRSVVTNHRGCGGKFHGCNNISIQSYAQ